MVGHGLRKCTSAFGGDGLETTATSFERIGLRPGRRHAALAAASEIFAGVSLATGVLAPIGAVALVGTMTVAAGRVHASKGLWVNKGGCEYNLVLGGIGYAVAAAAPRPASLDERLFGGGPSHLRALGATAVGLAAGIGVLAAHPDTRDVAV